jgi:class 3 adenylate cyclase
MSDSIRKLAVIVFTDIVNFTRLSADNEPVALQLLNTQRSTLKPIVGRHHGKWLKEIGDGLLLSFNTSKDAISAYESLMELWKDGDERLPKRKDAIKRLANLKKAS